VFEPESSTLFLYHQMVEEIADCAVVTVPKTCGGRQRFVRRHVLRVYSHDQSRTFIG